MSWSKTLIKTAKKTLVAPTIKYGKQTAGLTKKLGKDLQRRTNNRGNVLNNTNDFMAKRRLAASRNADKLYDEYLAEFNFGDNTSRAHIIPKKEFTNKIMAETDMVLNRAFPNVYKSKIQAAKNGSKASKAAVKNLQKNMSDDIVHNTRRLYDELKKAQPEFFDDLKNPQIREAAKADLRNALDGPAKTEALAVVTKLQELFPDMRTRKLIKQAKEMSNIPMAMKNQLVNDVFKGLMGMEAIAGSVATSINVAESALEDDGNGQPDISNLYGGSYYG